MQHTRIVIFFLFALSSNWCKAEVEAVSVFVESCRNSGENLYLIHSGYAEFESSRENHSRSEQQQKLLETVELRIKEKLEAKVRKSLANAPSDVLKSNIEKLKRMSISPEGKMTFRHKMLFIGNDIFFKQNDVLCKRYRATEQFDKGEWRLVDFVIMEGSPNGAMVSAGFMPGTRTATVEAVVRPGYEFQRFGRMQKSSAYHTMLQCMGQDRKKFLISEKTIQTFKSKMKEKNYTFETTGTDSYDGDKTATVVEIKCEGRVVERFWIDPSRGYICPLIQCFDEKGKIETECKSSGYFLHDKTGLWYPENYEETQATPFPVKRVYTLNRETFQLNQAVADEMFALDIPEKTKVIDKRSGEKETNYTAMEKGVLSLSKGGLDLEKMKWLMREGDLTYGKEEPSAAVQGFRYVSMTAGIILITFALFMKYREWRAKK